MIYAIAGGARMGAFQLNESLLERIPVNYVTDGKELRSYYAQ